jgi:hypothetical protein
MLLIHLFSFPNVLHDSWNIRYTFDEHLSPFCERLRETLPDVASQSLPLRGRS